MNIGRLTVAILKVVMCTVGCAIAVLLIWSINVHHINKLYFVWVLGGAIFGLCVGMSWVIERKEVRTAFVVPTLFGLVIWLVLVSGSRGGPHPVYDWHMKVLVLGLLIGSVWALSRAGAFKTQQDQKTVLTDSRVNVIEQIRELAALKSEEILTDEEFESKKQELLARL